LDAVWTASDDEVSARLDEVPPLLTLPVLDLDCVFPPPVRHNRDEIGSFFPCITHRCQNSGPVIADGNPAIRVMSR
jgi:hypothetical protein